MCLGFSIWVQILHLHPAETAWKMAANGNAVAMAHCVVDFLRTEDPSTLAKWESDLGHLQKELGVDVEEFWQWPLPAGAVQEGPKSVLVRQEDYPVGSIFPVLRKRFTSAAFMILREELNVQKSLPDSMRKEGWKKDVLKMVNATCMESQAHYFVPIGKEIYMATPSHPAFIMESFGGPFSLTDDGVNFVYHLTGIFLQQAITVKPHWPVWEGPTMAAGFLEIRLVFVSRNWLQCEKQFVKWPCW